MQFFKGMVAHHVAPLVIFEPPSALINKDGHAL
jgi:hypothetical protein